MEKIKITSLEYAQRILDVQWPNQGKIATGIKIHSGPASVDIFLDGGPIVTVDGLWAAEIKQLMKEEDDERS